MLAEVDELEPEVELIGGPRCGEMIWIDPAILAFEFSCIELQHIHRYQRCECGQHFIYDGTVDPSKWTAEMAFGAEDDGGAGS